MNNNFLSSRAMMGAAIVGLVGAAGVFIYEQIYAEKRRAMLVREVARLDKQVTSMRSELEALRELQKETQLRRAKQREKQKRDRAERAARAAGDATDAAERSYASDSEYFTDYQSVMGELAKQSASSSQTVSFGERSRERSRSATCDAPDAAERSYASDSEYFTDYQSVMGTDHEMDSEEFYDVHTDDDDDDTLRESIRNGHVTNALDEDPSDKADDQKSTQKNST